MSCWGSFTELLASVGGALPASSESCVPGPHLSHQTSNDGVYLEEHRHVQDRDVQQDPLCSLPVFCRTNTQIAKKILPCRLCSLIQMELVEKLPRPIHDAVICPPHSPRLTLPPSSLFVEYSPKSQTDVWFSPSPRIPDF